MTNQESHMSASRARASVQQPAAADCAQRHTGIDWREECAFAIPEPPQRLTDPLRDRVEAALAQRVNFQMEAFIAEYALGEPRDIGLMKRIGDIARSLGWRPHRTRTRDHRFFTEWRRICP